MKIFVWFRFNNYKPYFSEWNIFFAILKIKTSPPPAPKGEKIRLFYAFHNSNLFIMIQGLFLDKILIVSQFLSKLGNVTELYTDF